MGYPAQVRSSDTCVDCPDAEMPTVGNYSTIRAPRCSGRAAHKSPPKDLTVRMLHFLGWSTGALFFFYAYVLRVAPSVMIDEMMRGLSVGGAVIGNLSAVYFFGYAGMQVPVGLLIDRF